MSSLTSPHAATLRAQLANTARMRARLAIVPARTSSAPRTPFALLLALVLVGGVVGLLMFNTHMQQKAFEASELQRTSERLLAQQQELNLELQQLRDPQRVAAAARQLGMVSPPSPAFLRLADGRVIGQATPATSDGGLFVRGYKATKPPALRPRPRIVKVRAPASAGVPGQHVATTGDRAGNVVSTASNRRASATRTPATDRKKPTRQVTVTGPQPTGSTR